MMEEGNQARRHAEDQRVICRLKAALHVLENHQRAGMRLPLHMAAFLSALNRKLTEAERRYAAVAFGNRDDIREQLTAIIAALLGMDRASVIEGIRAHFEAPIVPSSSAERVHPVCAFLGELRAQILAKAAQLV